MTTYERSHSAHSAHSAQHSAQHSLRLRFSTVLAMLLMALAVWPAQAMAAPATITRLLLGSSNSNTVGSSLTIGEQAIFRVQVTLPASSGWTDVILKDQLPAGMAIVSLDSLDGSGNVVTSATGGFAGALAAATVSPDGSTVAIDMPLVDTGAGSGETITLIYTAVVLNVAGNQRGAQLSGQASWSSFESNVSTGPAGTVTVIEPGVQVSITPATVMADAGTDTYYYMTVTADSGAQAAPVYDVKLTHILPSGLQYVSGSLEYVGGKAPSSYTGLLEVNYGSLDPGQSGVMRFAAHPIGSVLPGQQISQTPSVTWTSLPNVGTTPQSPYSAASTERTGNTSDPGGTANDYRANATAATTMVPSSSLSGVVYLDYDNNGTFDGGMSGDFGISGIGIQLTGTDHLGNVISTVQFTGSAGEYSFTGLRAGTYQLTEMNQPAGFIDGPETPGSPTLSGTPAFGDAIASIVIPSGQSLTGVDFNFSERVQTDLSVTADAAVSAALPGTTVEYTLKVTNNGTASANAVVITNPLPGGTTYQSATQPGGWTITSPSGGQAGTVVFSNGSIGPGNTVTFTVTLLLDTGLLRSSDLQNVVTVTSNTFDSNLRNNYAVAHTTVAALGDADLRVTQTSSVPVVINPMIYTIVLRNDGPAPSNVTLTDTVPGNMTVTGTSTAGISCTNTATTVTCQADAFGGVATIDVYATPTGPGSGQNIIHVTGSAPDPDLANNDSSLTTRVVSPSETALTIEQVAPMSAAHGDTIEYMLTIKNAGPHDANNVMVDVDALPAGMGFVSNTVNCFTVFPCYLGTLASGDTRTIATKVAVSAAATGAIPRTVSVYSDNGTTFHASNTAETSVGPIGSADLQIVKFDSPRPAVTGTTVGHTAVLINNGPGAALNTYVTETLPDGATPLNASTNLGTCNSGPGFFNCPIGDVGATKVVTLSFTTQTPSAQPANDRYTSMSIASSPSLDPVASNTSAVTQTPVTPRADLQVMVSAVPLAMAGASYSTMIAVTNNGPSDAMNVVITSPMPAGVTFVSNGNDCTRAFPCSFASIPAGETRAISTIWMLPSNFAGATVTASASVTSDTTDPQTSNNTSSSDITVGVNSDLSLAMSGSPAVSAGGSVSYTLTVTNYGPSDAANVEVAKSTPAGLTFTSNSGDCTTTFPCNFSTLAAGRSRTIVATFKVSSGYTSPNPIPVAAIVASSTPDSDPLNNQGAINTVLGPPSADLSVTMTAPPNATPGLPLAYTITVQNNGPADAADVVVSDTTPSGLTHMMNIGGCATAFPCSLGTMVAGDTRTITATFNVPLNYTTPDPIVNTATVASSTADPVSTNDMATANVSIGADVSVTMTDAPDPVVAGTNLTFTITVTNAGALDAAGLALTDTLPAGTTFVSLTGGTNASCTAPAVGASGTINCTWATPVPVSSQVFTLTVHVDPAMAAGDTIANTVTLSSGTNDPTVADHGATTTTTVTTSSDVSLTMTVDNATPNVTNLVTYTVTAHNAGPSQATGVVITDSLPAGLELVTPTPSVGAYNQATGAWTIGTMPNGANATLQLLARVTSDGPLTNTATKTASNEPDPDSSNNSAAVTLTSNLSADVRVLKTVDVASANVGDTVTFTIAASNAGPNDATGVRIVDTLPAGLTFASATPSAGTFDPVTGTWELGALANAASATLSLQTTVTQAGPILNEAHKAAQTEHDPNPANDVSGVTVNGLSADLQVVKTMAPSSEPRVGQEVFYSITVTNNGPSAATHVLVRELLPPGLGFVASTSTIGVYVPQTGIWDVGTLTASGGGSFGTLAIRAVILSPDAIVNRAMVLSADQPDPNPNNNESSVSTTPLSNLLNGQVQITGDPSIVGSTLDVAFQVKNTGTAPTIPPLTLAVPLPDGYSYLPTGQAIAVVAAEAAAAAAEWNCTLVGQTVFCKWEGVLAPGASSTAHIHIKVNEVPSSGSALFAYLTNPGVPGSAQNVLQAPLGPPQTSTTDVAVSQSVSILRNNLARTLTYAIAVTNKGASVADDVVLTDVLPAGVTFVSAVAGAPAVACDRTNSYVACHLGTMQPGRTVAATIVLTATAPGSVVHTISAGSEQADANSADNQSALITSLDTAAAENDTDGDGMPDAWESAMGLPVTIPDANDDPDHDGLTNIQEYQHGTHPRSAERRYFAEGASNDFFKTTIAVLNPDAEQSVSVMIELLQGDGTIVSAPYLLAPMGRVELDPRTLIPAGGTFSVLVESDRPVAADRDMRWDASGYGSSGESGAPAASETWYFAEGATKPYSLFYLIENPSLTDAAEIEVTYLLTDGRPPVVTTDTVAPHSRKTIFVNEQFDTHPSLLNAEVAATITSTNQVPIVAERAMYLNLPGQPMGAGHAGLGAPALSTSWFFAEGATGSFFKEYVLLANPQSSAVDATVRYLLPDGTSFEKTYGLKPTSRLTIDVAGEDARLAATAVSAIVTATQPIVAERVMWWPGHSLSPTWYEAHVSLGATATGTGWAIAGGASGSSAKDQTYALVANQESRAGKARVTVSLNDGSTIVREVDLQPTSRTTIDFSATFPETRNGHFSALIDSIGDSPVPIVVEWSRYSSPAGQFWGAGSAALATKVR